MKRKHVAGLLACLALTLPALAQEKAPTIQTNPPWQTSIALGLTVTDGNSESLLFTASANSTRKRERDEIILGANGGYGETTDPDTDETTKNAAFAKGFGQYNYLFTERFYAYARLDALHDDIAEVQYRFSFSPGVGYYFIKNPRTSLSGEVGPGLVHERVGGEDDTYATIRFAERFEHKFNDSVRLWQSLEFLPQIDDWNNFIINAEIGVEATLTKSLSLRVLAQDTYDNEPAEDREENDLKFITALAYKF